MIIIDEKSQPMRDVPPPYEDRQPPPFPISTRPSPTLDTLSPHLLLQIVHELFPQSSDASKGKAERRRVVLLYLSSSLRLVNKVFYVVSMHVLRSTYLPAYNSLIKRPYTTDPFPHTLPTTYESTASLLTLQHVHRETKVLDSFIALKVRQDVYMDDTEFHLENTESFRDMFDFTQPKSRLEDLISQYGVEVGVISRSDKPTTPHKAVSPPLQPVPYADLSVNFSIRKAGLVLATRTGKRTILEVSRRRDEKLESTAKLLVTGLRDMMNNRTFRFG